MAEREQKEWVDILSTSVFTEKMKSSIGLGLLIRSRLSTIGLGLEPNDVVYISSLCMNDDL